LVLIAEPDNPADPYAVAIFLDASDIPSRCDERLEERLGEFGHTVASIREQGIWHVGYIPKDFAKQLREQETVPVGAEVKGQFSCSQNGAPFVRLD
jgi:hypothetical protein